jgi:hypothetical protein
MDVLPIRGAKRSDERCFLDGDAVGVANSRASEQREKASPISQREANADGRDECSGVRRMADETICVPVEESPS